MAWKLISQIGLSIGAPSAGNHEQREHLSLSHLSSRRALSEVGECVRSDLYGGWERGTVSCRLVFDDGRRIRK